MSTLLDEITTYVATYPNATVEDVRETFGEPIHDDYRIGIYKTYVDMVFLRAGTFVHVQHRDFGHTQIIRVREVEPMEVVQVKTIYTAAHPNDGEGPGHWQHQTGIVPNAKAFLDALGH